MMKSDQYARSTHWDSCKGLAIIAVIVTHSAEDSLGFTEDSYNWMFGVLLRQFSNFAVPLFLALAGLFSGKQYGESVGFFRKRLVRIAPPYVVWSLLFIAINSPNLLLCPKSLIVELVLGSGIEIGYFVIVLIQFIVLTPLLSRISSRKIHIVIMVSLFTLGMVISYVTRMYHADKVFSHFPFYCITFLSWSPFFHLGLCVSKYRKEFAFLLLRFRRFLLPALCFGLFMSIIEGFYFAHHGLISLGVSQIKFTSFVTAFFVFMLVLYHEGRSVIYDHPVIAELGRSSYFIYLSHLLFLRHIAAFLKDCDALYEFQPVYILILAVLTLMTCCFMIRVLRIVFPEGVFQMYFGGVPNIASVR